jgi:hypothetical protein
VSKILKELEIEIAEAFYKVQKEIENEENHK